MLTGHEASPPAGGEGDQIHSKLKERLNPYIFYRKERYIALNAMAVVVVRSAVQPARSSQRRDICRSCFDNIQTLVEVRADEDKPLK